jgi:hypothetical protein
MKVPFHFAPALLLAAGALHAQAQTQTNPLTSVSLFKVSPDKVNAFVEKGKAFGPTLDKLMGAGTITGYGIQADLLHVPGEQNVAFWIDTPNFASFAKADQAIGDFQKENPGLMKEIYGLTDIATHQDLMVQSLEGRSNARNVKPGVNPVIDFDMERVKPGKTQEMLALFRKYDKPVLEKLVDDGAIVGYSFDTEAVHTMAPGTVWLLTILPEVGAKDKVRAAFREAYGKLPETERNMVDRLQDEMSDAAAHRDSLSELVFFKMK